MTLSYEDLRRQAEAILRGFGYSREEARLTAWALVEADARGVPSHGVSRLAFYRANMDGGFAHPGREPEIVWETPGSLVVDGHDGVGCYISEFAVNRMIGKAEACGSAFCAVRNSNHYGMAGLWAEKAAERGMIGMAFTNTRTCGIPTFGRRRLLGTNPIAVAVPSESGTFLLDMATTTVAHGKVEVYDRRKRPMPLGWAVDEHGRGTTDATAFEKLFYENPVYGGHLFLGGEGEENGGHKGYGLGLLVELLCAGLSLGVASYDTFAAGRGAGIAHFFGAMRMDLFGDPSSLRSHVAEILREVRNSECAAGRERIYIHGEKESEARARALREGVDIDEATCEMLRVMTEKYARDAE
jgi:Malate/L-lactate dehydrogenases